MTDSPLITKSKCLALDIIQLCNSIQKEKHEYVLSKQLLRSGTSIGANIQEAFFGYSKADYAAKLQVALKECAETQYWLELLAESGIYDCLEFINQCIEIKKILIVAVKRAKENIEA